MTWKNLFDVPIYRTLDTSTYLSTKSVHISGRSPLPNMSRTLCWLSYSLSGVFSRYLKHTINISTNRGITSPVCFRSASASNCNKPQNKTRAPVSLLVLQNSFLLEILGKRHFFRLQVGGGGSLSLPADLPDVLCRGDPVLDTVLPVAAGWELVPHHHRDTVVHAAWDKVVTGEKQVGRIHAILDWSRNLFVMDPGPEILLKMKTNRQFSNCFVKIMQCANFFLILWIPCLPESEIMPPTEW